jgi:hypothetical protein
MNEFKLVNGVFSAEEAKTVLMTLITNKINFHSLNSFSDYVRFNEDIDKSKKRISELTTTREEILKLMEEAEKKGMKLNIKSNISIELI